MSSPSGIRPESFALSKDDGGMNVSDNPPRPPGRPGPSDQVRAFDQMYDGGPPPWDIGRPQPTFVELADQGLLVGRVLDIGCGTGEHALMAAARGLDATGIDAVPQAIGHAQRKAEDRGLTARFLVANALRLADLGEQFDTVLDCGLFHIFSDEDRPRFVASLRAVMSAGGHYYLLCFSDRQPGTMGPRRVSTSEIREAFEPPAWRVDAIDAVTMDTNMQPIRAWRASISRV
jgi:SAM-dependent methyltransferase